MKNDLRGNPTEPAGLRVLVGRLNTLARNASKDDKVISLATKTVEDTCTLPDEIKRLVHTLEPGGEIEDRAVSIASMLLAIGRDARVVIAQHPRRPAEWWTARVEVRCMGDEEGKWLRVDPERGMLEGHVEYAK